MAAGPASYGMTDTMGRMHSDAQFAGSSSVPAHVEKMHLIGIEPTHAAPEATALSTELQMHLHYNTTFYSVWQVLIY